MADPGPGKHSIGLGAAAVSIVAQVVLYWANVAIEWKAPPPMDMPTATAHAALIVWFVSFFAARKGIDLPPLEGVAKRAVIEPAVNYYPNAPPPKEGQL